MGAGVVVGVSVGVGACDELEQPTETRVVAKMENRQITRNMWLFIPASLYEVRTS
jgi:hypothetical protein